MRRTIVGFVLVALVVAPAWANLEAGDFPTGEVMLISLLAFLPTLAVALRRGPLLVAFTLVGAALVASAAAFEIPLSDARRGERDFWGPMLGSFRDGFLEFWDTRVPFDAVEQPGMHGVVLLAIFAFLACAGMAIAARRTVPALALLLVGAGWPATMAGTSGGDDGRPLLFGALILGVALALLVLLRGGTRGIAHAVVIGAALVAASVAGATTDAVAKRGFVEWDSWDIYDKPDDPVDVRYVWDSNYDGISFPEKETTVFTVKTASRRSLYWRATTLDDYTGTVWREDRKLAANVEGSSTVAVGEYDPLLPSAARERRNWVRQDVTIEGLDDNRLVGSAQAVQWEPNMEGFVSLFTNGAVVRERSLERGQKYSVWSYVPPAKPSQLNGAGTSYPDEVTDYLRVQESFDLAPLPNYGSPGRDTYMDDFFEQETYLDQHRAMFDTAQEVTDEATTPYQAAVALESWFRGEEGGFVYDESPPVAGVRDPLPFFLETKRGYCQHYAGAMALMLRFIGVPARVAAGFTSGSYDTRTKEWTVTDHNAHTWVEVYFPRFGWIPFDPTPERGELSAQYSPYSAAFDAAEAAAIGGGFQDIEAVRDQLNRAAGLEQREAGDTSGGAGGAAAEVAERGRSVIGFLLLVLAVAVAALLLLKEARRRLRFATRDPRELAGACRRDLAGYLADQGVAVPSSATPREVGELAEHRFDVSAKAFVGAVDGARYGPPSEARSRARRARSELRRVRGALRKQLGAAERIRGAVSLRSFGA